MLAIEICFSIEHTIDVRIVCTAAKGILGIRQECHLVGQDGAARNVGDHTMQDAIDGVEISLQAVPLPSSASMPRSTSARTLMVPARRCQVCVSPDAIRPTAGAIEGSVLPSRLEKPTCIGQSTKFSVPTGQPQRRKPGLFGSS